MKFLAILEDSFREAIDTTIFTIQVGLSVVLVVLVGSTSFQPVDATEAMQRLVTPLNQSAEERAAGLPIRGGAAPGRTSYSLVRVEPLDGSEGTPVSPYRLTLAVRPASPDETARLRQDPGPVEEYARANLGRLGGRQFLQVASVEPASRPAGQPRDEYTLFFDVTTRPTADTRLFWPHHWSVLFGLVDVSEREATPLGQVVFFIENHLVNGVAAWFTILLGIVITANFLPSMLRKGAIDLMLVRPLHRVRLVLFKYLAGVVYMLANFAVLVSALWLVVGLRTGVWRPGLLLSVGAMTFFFAILYAVSALYGLLTRSATVAILVTCIAWFGFWLVGTLYTAVDATRDVRDWPAWVYPTLDTLHYTLPRTGDLSLFMSKVLSAELLTGHEKVMMDVANLPPVLWGESLTISVGFVALLLSVGCWRFWRRDY